MEAFQDEIRSNSTVKELKQLREIIIDCTKNIKSNDATFNISTLPTVSEKLTNYMKDYVDSVKEIESYQKAFEIVNHEIDKLDEEEGGDIETFDQYVELDIYSKLFEEISEKEYNNPTTSEIQAQLELEKILRPPEEEVQFETPASRQIPKDPMTKRNIKVAVKSTVCNHLYDKDGIEEYFRLKEQANKRGRIQCPQAGCTNKNMSRRELVPDEETNRLIQSLSR